MIWENDCKQAQQRIAELEKQVSLANTGRMLAADLLQRAEQGEARLAACQSKLEATSLNGHREMERRVALQERLAEVVAALKKAVEYARRNFGGEAYITYILEDLAALAKVRP